jgi:hypothetical protein
VVVVDGQYFSHVTTAAVKRILGKFREKTTSRKLLAGQALRP